MCCNTSSADRLTARRHSACNGALGEAMHRLIPGSVTLLRQECIHKGSFPCFDVHGALESGASSNVE